MRKKIKAILKYLFFFSIGVIIFWLIYKDLDIEMMKKVLLEDVNYFWVGVSLVIGIFSHLSRAARWNLLIEPLGARPRFSNTFMAVMTGYLMNLVIPRMGEISRCGVLAKYEKISFVQLIGTVVTERIIDVLILLFMTMLAILAQSGYMLEFLRQNPEVAQKFISVVTSPVLIGILLTGLLLIILLRKRVVRSRLYRKIGITIQHLKEGVISFRYVKKKKAMIFHSFFIWILYYLMLYTAFFAFDFTRGLSPLAGLTTFVMGSFGMLAPVQGGLGTWHFMTKESLALYGITNENGIIFAFVAHTTMNLLLIVLGLLSLLALPLVNRKEK